jgi:hypothetical protein
MQLNPRNPFGETGRLGHPSGADLREARPPCRVEVKSPAPSVGGLEPRAARRMSGEHGEALLFDRKEQGGSLCRQ